MMEVLSIESFLKFGYEFRLYCYEPVDNVPAGVVVCDGREILSADEIFVHRRGFGKGSPAGFSDLFRYKLLLDKGQWWVDTDVICVRPFDFAADHVIGNHRHGAEQMVNGAVIKMPAQSRLARFCYEASLGVDRSCAKWGAIGPKLLQQAINTLGMSDCVQPPDVFYPIDYWRIDQFFEGRDLPSETCALHLWHAMWQARGIDPNRWFPPDCLYEKMRCRFITGYEPANTTEEQRQRIIADLIKANAPLSPSRLKQACRWVRSQLPWRSAA